MSRLYCTTCGAAAPQCLCLPGTRHLVQRQRSVIGTTLLVLLTVFVIAPVLLIAGCGAMISGTGSNHRPSMTTTQTAPAKSTGNPYTWPSETPR